MTFQEQFVILLRPSTDDFCAILASILGRPFSQEKVKVTPTEGAIEYTIHDEELNVEITMTHDFQFTIIPFNSKGNKFPTKKMPFDCIDNGRELTAFLLARGFITTRIDYDRALADAERLNEPPAEDWEKKAKLNAFAAMVGWIVAAVAVGLSLHSILF